MRGVVIRVWWRLEAFVRWLFASHKLLQSCDLPAGAEDDEGIAGVDLVLGGGGSVELAFGASEGEDHGAGLLPDLELAYGVVGQG